MSKLDSTIDDFRRYAHELPDDAEWIKGLVARLERLKELANKPAPPASTPTPAPRLEPLKVEYRGVRFDPAHNERCPWRAYMLLEGRRWYIGAYRTERGAARRFDRMCWELTHDESLLNFPEEYEQLDWDDSIEKEVDNDDA